MQQGFAGKLMYTDRQRERIEKEQDLRAQEAVIASARDTINQEERKIAQIGADYRRQLQTERVDIAAQLEKANQELAKQVHRHEYLELKAPQDGIVKDLATHTVGTVASPGTILMTLVPKDENLRAEVWVKNDDIGFVTRVYKGIKENAAIFSHPNPWAVIAECKLGRGSRAMKFYDALLPFAQNDRIEVRQMMYLSFSFDHRVIDGAVGADFAYAVIKYLESPANLLLEMA